LPANLKEVKMLKLSKLVVCGAISLVLLTAGFVGAVDIPSVKPGEDIAE
jgi:hypothetical protein